MGLPSSIYITINNNQDKVKKHLKHFIKLSFCQVFPCSEVLCSVRKEILR